MFYAWLVNYPEQFPANSWQFCCSSVALLGKVLGSHTVSSNSEICTCMAASFRRFLDVSDLTAAKFWSSWIYFKEVCAHCYSASLVRTLFIRHARATSFASACTKSKSQQNIELMTFAVTWSANIFVGCSVTPTFFSADHFLFWFSILSIILKNKKICMWEVLIFSHILFK